ncbi:MAG: hypothetical protein FWC12_12170 [Treponema sp.]|nr:hypothetical protein [Treponema sp.]
MSSVISIALIAVAGALGLMGFVFTFVGKMVKGQQDVTKMKMQKEILELEIQKQNSQIRLLEEEGKKYDKIINERN